MDLLRRGGDLTVIALWLGHESIETAQIYLNADVRLKERVLAHADPSGTQPSRLRPSDSLFAFLKSLCLCRPPVAKKPRPQNRLLPRLPLHHGRH